jgi:hypothetical protein
MNLDVFGKFFIPNKFIIIVGMLLKVLNEKEISLTEGMLGKVDHTQQAPSVCRI